MSDNPDNSPEREEEEPLSYTPASFEKRVAAWVGVFYAVMLTLLVTYMMATGRVITGIAPLLLPPVAVGVAIITIYRYRKGEIREGRNFTIALVFLCFIAVVLGLVTGIPYLLANFGIYLPDFPVTLS